MVSGCYSKRAEYFGGMTMVFDWITNKKMDILLKKISGLSNKEELKIDIQKLKKLIIPPFKEVRDCIIISEKSKEILENAYEKSIELNMDRTGYEAGSSETRIDTYFDNDISIETGTEIALIVLEMWAFRLKELQPGTKFCLIVFSDENHVEIRFHKIHEGENMWLDEKLEHYEDGAVGYALI